MPNISAYVLQHTIFIPSIFMSFPSRFLLTFNKCSTKLNYINDNSFSYIISHPSYLFMLSFISILTPTTLHTTLSKSLYYFLTPLFLFFPLVRLSALTYTTEVQQLRGQVDQVTSALETQTASAQVKPHTFLLLSCFISYRVSSSYST